MALSIAWAMQQFQAAYFANNTVVGGVLKFPEGKTPSQTEQDALYSQWYEQRQGPTNAFQLLMTNADFQPITSNAEAAQLIQARQVPGPGIRR